MAMYCSGAQALGASHCWPLRVRVVAGVEVAVVPTGQACGAGLHDARRQTTAANKSLDIMMGEYLVPEEGLEPPTHRLRSDCSTN